MAPAVVVPGHGGVGDVGLVAEVRAYLEDVRALVHEAAGEGARVEQLKERLEPELRTRYADWDNPVWIPAAIERFHSELGG
jgi:alpha-beta hydrolase superfamily lysophospholipase